MLLCSQVVHLPYPCTLFSHCAGHSAAVGNARIAIDGKDGALPRRVPISTAHLMYQHSSPSVVELGPLDTTWPDIAIWKSEQL